MNDIRNESITDGVYVVVNEISMISEMKYETEGVYDIINVEQMNVIGLY
jgi:hypothetical protein